MLALSRRIDAAIRIGDNLILEVLDIEGGAVTLELERPDPGYDRPQWMVVGRRIGEVFQVAEGVPVLVGDVVGSHVRLGIDAPGDINIVRTKLEQRPSDLLARESGAPDTGWTLMQMAAVAPMRWGPIGEATACGSRQARPSPICNRPAPA